MGIDWYELGWKRGYETLTNAKGSVSYPTRDKYSKDDENKYCLGYADCIESYLQNGFPTIEAYANERDGN